MDVDDAVGLGGVGVEVQAVGETAAPAPPDADAEHGAFGQVLAGDEPLDFVGGLFTQDHTHGNDLLVQDGGDISRRDGRAADGLV